jgi:hypothetical protein
MSTSAPTNDPTGLPPFPGKRSARCPFDPPQEYTDWRETEGLQRAVSHGEPLWVVSGMRTSARP